MTDNQHFQYINKLRYFKEIYGKSKPFKLQLKSLFLPPQRTLDLEYQDGGDELQNLITEITEMRDLGLFISVDRLLVLLSDLAGVDGWHCLRIPRDWLQTKNETLWACLLLDLSITENIY